MIHRRGYFNWSLAIVLVLAVLLVTGTAVALRQYNRTGRAQAALKAGNAAYDKEQWDEAALNLGRYISVHPDDVAILLKYAQAQLRQRPPKASNIQQAIAAYRNALRLDTANEDAARRLIEVYLAVDVPGEANAVSQRFLTGNPGPHPEIHLMRGAAMAALGSYAAAQAEWQGIIDANAAHIRAYDALGKIAEQRPAEATQTADYWFDLAVQKNPQSASARILRAGHLIRKAASGRATVDPNAIVADLDAAEALNPTETNVRLELARVWLKMGMDSRARSNCDIVAKTEPANPVLWDTLADLALRSQSKQTMQEVAEKGMAALGDKSLDFVHRAAELFIRAGQLDRATQCVATMKENDMLPSVAAFLEGLICRQRDDLPGAIQGWERAMSLGYNTLMKSPRIRLMLAAAYTQQGDLQSALAQLQTACSEYPDEPACVLELATHLTRMGDWAGASRYAQAVAKVLPNNIQAPLINAEAQMRMLSLQGLDAGDPQWDAIDKQLIRLEGMPAAGNSPRFLRVRMALLRKDVPAASTLMSGMVPTDQEKLRVTLTSAECLAASGKTQEAIGTLEGAITQYPDASEPVRALGLLLRQQGDQARCEAVLKQGLARLKAPAAQMELGLLLCAAYGQWQRTDDAVALLEGMAQKYPNAIWIKRHLLDYRTVGADAAKAQGLVDEIKKLEGEAGWQWRYEQARVWFLDPSPETFSRTHLQMVDLLKRNLGANPNDHESRKLLAAAYERAGEIQQAMIAYQEVLDRSPNDLTATVRLVTDLTKTKEYDKANRLIEQAASRRLFAPATLQELQLASAMQQGELGLASDLIQQIWSRDPNNPKIGLTWATIKLRQGRLDEADRLLSEGRKLDPNSYEIASTQVQLYLQQGKSQEALQICNDLVTRIHTAASYVLRGRALAALGQKDAARKDFDAATTLEPRDPQVWISRSDFNRSDGKIAEAAADMGRAVALDPNSAAIQRLAIPLWLRSPDPQYRTRAEKMLTEALQSRPDDVSLQLIKVQRLLEDRTSRSEGEADRLLDSMTSNWPKTRDAWILWADLQMDQGDTTRALETARRGLVHNPKDRSLLLMRARAEAALSPTLAISTLESLRKDGDPNDTGVVLTLANAYMGDSQPDKTAALLQGYVATCRPADRLRCQAILVAALYRKGDKDGARAVLAEMLKAAPEDLTAMSSQVWLLGQEGKWDEVVARVAEWGKAHPQDVDTPTSLALSVSSMSDPQARRVAEQILQDVLSRSPQSVAALQVQAQILQTEDRIPEAVEAYKKILEVDRKNVTSMNNLAWILSERLEKAQEALTLANQGLEINPDYLDLLDTRGVIYCRLGRFDKAAEDLTRCVDGYPKGNPAGVGSRLHLAKAYRQLNRKQDASKVLEEGLDRYKSIGGLTPEELAEAQRLGNELAGQ
jgi:tetratricopeptide (TPR) repeat protein